MTFTQAGFAFADGEATAQDEGVSVAQEEVQPETEIIAEVSSEPAGAALEEAAPEEAAPVEQAVEEPEPEPEPEAPAEETVSQAEETAAAEVTESKVVEASETAEVTEEPTVEEATEAKVVEAPKTFKTAAPKSVEASKSVKATEAAPEVVAEPAAETQTAEPQTEQASNADATSEDQAVTDTVTSENTNTDNNAEGSETVSPEEISAPSEDPENDMEAAEEPAVTSGETEEPAEETETAEEATEEPAEEAEATEEETTDTAASDNFDFDNSTTLADGEYAADEFTYEFAGGTGKARLDLDKIVVTNGKAMGVFTSSSSYMTHVYIGQVQSNNDDPAIYDPDTDTIGPGVYKITDKKVKIPVKINEQTEFAARTTIMSEPHWIKYNYTITMEEPEPFVFDNSTDLADGSYSLDDLEYEFTGGTGKARLDLESLTVKNGFAEATFASSSDYMTHVYLAKTADNSEDPSIYDPATDRMGQGTYKIVGKKVTIPVKVGTQTDLSARTTIMSEPHWINYQYTINVKEDAVATFDNSTDLDDGTYTPDDFSFTGGTGKAKVTCDTVTVKDGKAEATFTVSSDYMTHVYLGEAASNDEDPALYDPETDETGTDVYAITDKQFTVPVRLNEEVGFAIRTTAMSDPHWVNYSYNITVKQDNNDPEEEVTPQKDPSENEGSGNKEEDTQKEDKTPSTRQKLKDGTYKVLTTTDRKMFYIYPKDQDPAYSILTIEDGKMTATITLTGEGYDYVFMGTPEEAAKAPKSQWIKAKIVNGYYTFTIPVSKLDKKLTITPHSKKYAADPEMADQAWRPNKWIKFYSGDAIKVKDGSKSTAEDAEEKEDSAKDEETGKKSGKQTDFNNDHKKDKESKWKDDSSGTTSAVNNSTTLKDGVYTPDSFSWSGGSGRLAYIRCDKITVTGGKAFATIVFGSSSYDSLRANGRVYSRSGGGNSTFVIPVNLNANNIIIGRTTAMSQAHWVKYTIYIGKAESKEAAAKSEEAKKEAAEAKVKIAEDAPEIMGLTYESTTEVEYAKYFKIFNYEGGVKLLSIDITDNTALKEEYTENAKAAVKNSENKDGVEYDDDGNIVAKSANEYVEALYHNNVINYLLVPEDFDVPAGLDKEYIIVQTPSEKTFDFSDEAIGFMELTGTLDAISMLGMAEEDIPNVKLSDGVKNETIVLAGDTEKPDYAKVIKEKPDLVILPGSLIPEKIEKDAENKEELEAEAEEMKVQLEKLESRFTALGVPVIIDRSAQEEEELAKAEWIKVYGALYGCEEAAKETFDEEVKQAEKGE